MTQMINKPKLVIKAFTNALNVGHFNCGSCNGCDIEIVSLLTPRFDVERFGITLHGSPRHCDVMLCTGPVTRQMEERLKRLYEQLPEPKLVIAVGTCAATGGVYQECYNVVGRLDKVVPVAAYIPGCPPRPEAMVDAVVAVIQKFTSDFIEMGKTEEDKQV